MAKEKSLLNSRYIIDGEPQELPPSRILGDVQSPVSEGTIVDESLDPAPGGQSYDPCAIDGYYDGLSGLKRAFPFAFPGQYTRQSVASALLDAIWSKGHFVLDDLSLKAKWRWRDEGVGTLAAFYRSVQACCEYADSLSLSPSTFDFSSGSCSFSVKASGCQTSRAVPGKMVRDSSSWIVYIPFDPSAFRLGGSLLAQSLNIGGGTAPETDDADYFMDCYEVVRELVEDGVALSGATVGEGGLMSALKSMKCGMTIDVADMMKAYPGSDVVRLLFAEVPGTVVQIDDNDFDYLDAELLLQDVLYFPLGHPDDRGGEINIKPWEKTGIENILASLLR